MCFFGGSMVCNKMFILAAFVFVTCSHISISMNSKQYPEYNYSDSWDKFAYYTLMDMSKNAEIRHLSTTNSRDVEAENYTEIDRETIKLLLEIRKQLNTDPNDDAGD